MLMRVYHSAKFSRICYFLYFSEAIFADAVNVTPNLLLYQHFYMLNFRGWRLILENYENLKIWCYTAC